MAKADLKLDELLEEQAVRNRGSSWGCYDFSKKSLAVICQAETSKVGIVLWTVGGHVKMEINEVGLDMDELGLEAPEPGIWVWEGEGRWWPGSYEHPDEGSMELSGDYRPPTPEEWLAIQKGECPWDDDEWRDDEWKAGNHGED